MNIIDYIVKFINHSHLRRKEFAKKISLSDSYVSEILSGKRNISLKFQKGFLDAFGFDVDELPEKMEKESASRVMERENIYRATMPVAHIRHRGEVPPDQDDKLVAAIIGLLPFMGFENKKDLLKHIYETYFMLLEEESEKEEEGGDSGK